MPNPTHSATTFPGFTRPEEPIDIGGITVRGPQRARNDDQFLVATLKPGLRVVDTSVVALRERASAAGATTAVIAVADGIGGEGAGDRASRAAVEALASCLQRDQRPEGDPLLDAEGILERAFALGQASIERLVRDGVGPERMGTTFTVAYVQPPSLCVAHVGDSRCYLWRGGALSLLTRDHTVAEDLRRGWGQEPEPGAPFARMLNRALGGGEGTHHRPDITRWDLAPGDLVLVCSDGLTHTLSDAAIARVLAAQRCAQSAANELARAVAAAGGRDDTSVVVAIWRGAAARDEASAPSA
jgi:protein phosphatase